MILAVLTLAGATSATAPGPAEDSVVDDFFREDLGRNWTVYNGQVGIIGRRGIGVVSRRGPMLGLGIVAYSAAAFRADQFSEAVISRDRDPAMLVQVFVRRRQADAQRYGFHWRPLSGEGQWEIKRDGGPAAPVLTAVPGAQPMPGDTIRIEVRGSVIRGFHNGRRIATAVDPLLTDAGQPGMVFNIYAVTRFPSPAVERWTGGSLPSSR